MNKRYMLPLLVPIQPEHRDLADGKLAVCRAGLEACAKATAAAREEKKRLEKERDTVNQRLERKLWEDQVLCEEHRTGNVVEVIRLDTGEVVRTFTVDEGEPQASLSFSHN